MYDSGDSRCKAVTTVDGISFEVVSNISRNATAITNISSEMDFEPNQTYLYKDGETRYFLFNINSLVLVCERGTNFGFSTVENKASVLENDSIMGVWLNNPHKKLEYRETSQNGIYKMIATVNAQVALTKDLYNDFTGKMAYLYDGTTEWTMFVGSLGEDFDALDKDTKKILEYMVSTLSTYEKVEEEKVYDPEITLGGNEESKKEDKTAEEIIAEDKEVKRENLLSENSVSNNTITVESEEIGELENLEKKEPEEIEIIEEEPKNIEDKEDIIVEELKEERELTIETEEIKENEEELPKEIPQTKEDNIAEVVLEIKDSVIAESNLNNQKVQNYKNDKVYESNIYSMLPIGKKAYADISYNDSYKKVIVNAEKVIKDSEAVTLIKNSLKNKNYKYFEAPDGCSWHVVKYSVDFRDDKNTGYVNTKLRGLDGEDLKYRGIRYSSRSYDIKVNDTEFYSYYAVPNGCEEYVLEFGDGGVEFETINSAYYRIK